MILAPLALAFAASDKMDLPLSVLFWSLRKGRNRDRFHPGWLFAVTVLVAAGAPTIGSPWFFPAAVLLTGWALWPVRGESHHAGVWVVVILVAAGGGFAAAKGLSQQHFDPFRRRTAMGGMWRLKMSNDVVMRVTTKPRMISTFLFREAAFDLYGFGRWSDSQPQFTPLTPQGDGTRWHLQADRPPPQQSFTV